MDYENKLREALDSDETDYEVVRWIELTFPELAESEDEKIRKELIAFFQDDLRGDYWHDLEVGHILAYLEKQKERPNIELIQRSWYMEGYTDGEFKREPRWNLKAGKGGPKYEENEKYGQLLEQKPEEIHNPTDEELEAHQKQLLDFKRFATKQAREHYISFVHDFEWDTFCGEILSYFNEMQKPVEWSAEDENALEYLHELISFGYTEKFFDAQTAADMREWLNTRLKSLRPTWKPSEELKDLPKWKKCAKESRLEFSLGLGRDDDGNRIIFYKGYEVLLNELFDKLPKQE